jgi:hypothetical protein
MLTEHEYKRLSAPVDFAAEKARLTPERRNAAEAMTLHMRLRSRVADAVTERDRDAYRRALRAFGRASRRLESRYNAITPAPKLELGNIHRAPAMPQPRRQNQQPATAKKVAAAA